MFLFFNYDAAIDRCAARYSAISVVDVLSASSSFRSLELLSFKRTTWLGVQAMYELVMKLWKRIH
jgi:hypothetical protein